jgi:ERCC4-type nuclease
MGEKRQRITVSTTKTKGIIAQLLAETGIEVLSSEDENGKEEIYILSPRLAVERRTGNSFLSGIKDKTLFTSAIYLSEDFEIPVFILEGQVNYEFTGFNPQAVRGAQAALVTIYGVRLLATPDEHETAAVIAMLAQQEQVGVSEISLVPKRKAIDLPDLQRRVVEMLPGCGRVAARQLLHHFGSLDRLVSASLEELHLVPGIGERKASEIYQVLHADYESIDTESQLEDAIQSKPDLLLEPSFVLIDRQHYIYTESGERQFVDLIFFNRETNDLVLVELKRGELTTEHEDQLRRYLDRAHQSPLLRKMLEGGARLHGILATVTECEYKPRTGNISVSRVARQPVIQELKRLRQMQLGSRLRTSKSRQADNSKE